MGLFDNLGGIVDGLTGQQEGEDEERSGDNLFGGRLGQGAQGQSSGIVGSLLGGFGGQGAAGAEGQPPAAQGGMAGMLETLAANGLGEHVSSWLGDGHNLPISPEQIEGALGSQQVQQLAANSGLPVGDFLQHLAQHLPQAASESTGAAEQG